jgi:glutamate racemase
VASPASSRNPRRPRAGIFDSGVGGLSVAHALHQLAPGVEIVYLADTAFFPYGTRSAEEIAARSVAIASRLIAEGVDVLVVACNTASSAALDQLREVYALPIVGMEPPLKPAVERSRAGCVAVLATEGTASGERLARLTETYGREARVFTLPMPGLADLVEAGEIEGERVESMLREALLEPVAAGIDEVALGCTHYGFLRPVLGRLVPEAVEVIDAAEPVARRVVWVLQQAGLSLDRAGEAGEVLCYATGDPEPVGRAIERLRASGAGLPPLRLAGLMQVVPLAGAGSGGA